MTSELKGPVCSWCNQPMVLQDDIFVCANTDCSACAESFLHKALTQAKQDLEITRKALKEYANKDNWGCIEDDRDRVWHTYWYFDCCDDGGWVNAQNALKQIERKDEQ